MSLPTLATVGVDPGAHALGMKFSYSNAPVFPLSTFRCASVAVTTSRVPSPSMSATETPPSMLRLVVQPPKLRVQTCTRRTPSRVTNTTEPSLVWVATSSRPSLSRSAIAGEPIVAPGMATGQPGSALPLRSIA